MHFWGYLLCFCNCISRPTMISYFYWRAAHLFRFFWASSSDAEESFCGNRTGLLGHNIFLTQPKDMTMTTIRIHRKSWWSKKNCWGKTAHNWGLNMCTETARCIMQFDRGVFVFVCLYVCVFDGQDCVQRAQDVCSSIGQLTGVQQRQQGSLVLARFFC